MNSIDSANSSRTVASLNYVNEIRELDAVMSESKVDMNLGYLILYEQWKQKILLSDGINEDENVEW